MPEAIGAEVVGSLLFEEAAALGIGELVGSAAATDFAAASLAGLNAGFTGGEAALAAGEVATGITVPASFGAVPTLLETALDSKVAQSVLGSAAGGVASAAVASGLAPKLPGAAATAAPAISQVPVMPLPNSQSVAAARRRSITSQLSRQGRASTILTDNGAAQTLGG